MMRDNHSYGIDFLTIANQYYVFILFNGIKFQLYVTVPAPTLAGTRDTLESLIPGGVGPLKEQLFSVIT